MRNGQLVLVLCQIKRGAFSGERVFQVPMAGGRGDYIGIAPVDHCLDGQRNPLRRDQPPAGVDIEGFVEAFLITNGGEEARIELPDGEAIRVPVRQVPYQREADQGSKYVPVRP